MPEITVDSSISLKPLISEDAEAIYSILKRDPSISRYVWWVQNTHDVESVRFMITDVKRWMTPYGIWSKNKLVGYIGEWDDIGYFDGINKPGVKSFGYFLDKDSRGTGVIAKSSQALMAELESNSTVHGYRVFAEDSNTASARVLGRLGFTKTSEVFTDHKNGWVERLWVKKPSDKDS